MSWAFWKHDCHVTQVLYDKDKLTFAFADGFWVIDKHPDNITKKTVRTNKAEVVFRLESGEPYVKAIPWH